MPSGDVMQSALSPAGPQAASIQHLWSLMLWVSAVVLALVLGFVFAAIVRSRYRRSNGPPPPASETILARSVGAAIAVTAVILVWLLIASVGTGRTIASLHASSAVTVAVTGHQWWWEIEYEDAVPSQRVLTANEL